jgi:hypothetical protein
MDPRRSPGVIPPLVSQSFPPRSEEPLMSVIAPLSRIASTRFDPSECRVDEFAALIDQVPDRAAYPHAADVRDRVLIFDSAALRGSVGDDGARADIEAEFVRALTEGPGVVVFRNAFDDLSIVDRVTTAF